MQTEFLWRAEMACRAAWPAEVETDLGGWCARRSGGSIRRVNSLNQRPHSPPIDERLLDLAETHYAGFGQPSVVRLVSFGECSAEPLARRGYEINGGTTTLHAIIGPTTTAALPGVMVADHPTTAWLNARNRIAKSDAELFRAMLDRIAAPRLFAGAAADGDITSVAYGALVDGLLVVESVATDPAHRGRGLARKAVGSLIAWAVSQGVSEAVLQVVTDNVPARALYKSLGFDTELFTYFYMRQP